MKRLLLLLVTVILSGCVRPVDHPISENCQWIEEDGSQHSLDLTRMADRRHLRFDAVTAEDVAIRWADKHFSHFPEWPARQNECVESLFRGVASHHNVDVATVRAYSRDRDIGVDAVVLVTFGIVYAAAAYIFIKRIRRRFIQTESGAWLIMFTLAIGFSLVGVLVGGLWSIVIEEFRMGSGHLSYRMNFIPARQYWLVLLICCFAIFWLMSLIRLKFANGLPENNYPADSLSLFSNHS